MNPEPAGPPRAFVRALPLILALATLAAFLPSMKAGFVNWDDDLNFLENPHYRGFSAANLKWMCTASHLGHYHPLTWFTLALDYSIWGMNPFGYHLTSVLIHAGNAVLLYFVIAAFLKLLGRPAPEWACAAAAAFYALHPLRVESVTWVTERRDVLCGLFTLLSLLFYLRRVKSERDGTPGGRWLALSALCFGASLMSKALSIALPAVLLVMDQLLRRLGPGERRRVLLEKIPFGLFALADSVIMLSAARQISAVRSTAGYDLLGRLGQAAYGLCFYLIKTVWPLGLGPLYRYDPTRRSTDLVYLSAIVAVGIVAALLIYRRRAWSGVLGAAVCYVLLVFPVLGLIVTGLHIAADRYTYLSLIPASFLVADLLARGSTRMAPAVASLLLLALGLLTFRQTTFWIDSERLWTRQIALDPDNQVAIQNRAYARHSAGNLSGALEDYSAAIARDPSAYKPLLNRGILRATLGQHEGAIADFTEALRVDPRSVDAYANRARSRSRRGDRAGALSDCREALRIDPNAAEAWATQGVVRYEQGDLQGALSDLTRSLEIAPSPDRYNNRGLAWFKAGRLPEAIADYSKSLELRPAHVETLVNRATARLLAKDARGALEDCDAAVRLRADSETLLRRATARGISGDLDGAIADCSEAIRLNPGDGNAYARRGVARMERGDAPAAAADFEAALKVSPPDWPQRAQVEGFLRRIRNP